VSTALAFTGNFDPGGILDRQQPEPWRIAEADRVERAITKLRAERDARLEDFHDTGVPAGRRVAGHDASRAVAEAIIEVDRSDRDVIASKARSGLDWANLVGTPAYESGRRHVLLRLGGKWLHSGLPGVMVLAQLLVQNRTMCIPPLAVAEVELLWRSLCDRHGTATT
jgi:hypothetical protein